MKKNLNFLFIIFITSFSLFSQEITYKTIGSCFSIKEGSPLYADSSKLNSYKKYDEDCLLYFILNNQTKIFGNLKTGYDQNDIIASLRIKDSDGEYRKYSLDHLKLPDLDTIPGFLTDTDKKYPKTGLLLLPEKYYKVLHKNSKQALLEEESYWEKDFHKNINNNRYDSWTEIFYPTSLFISYSYICFSRFDCDQDKMLHEISGLITDIKKINSNKYRLDFYNSISDDYSFEVDEIFKEINSKNNHFFLLDYDGDYVNVFLDSDKNIVDRFVISSDGVRSKIIEIAKKEKTSTSNIVWPRHADGSCDYEDGGKSAAESSVRKPAPAAGKTMTVHENLKLRFGEATSTQVLAVMSAGTHIKVLALGKAETIDGIASNWVKVKVNPISYNPINHSIKWEGAK